MDGCDITVLLRKAKEGDAESFERLSKTVYEELRQLARGYMQRESTSHTLQPTALVHEAFIRLIQTNIDYADRKHFFVIAARVMRRVLVDHARSKGREKRGGGQLETISLNETQHGANDGPALPILRLNEALTELSQREPRAVEAIVLVYFGGVSTEEAAEVLDVSRSTVYEDLRFAKAYLRKAMN